MTTGIMRNPLARSPSILPYSTPPGLEGFGYYKIQEIKGSTQGPLTNYQVRFRVYRTNGADSNDTTLGYRKLYVGCRVKPDFSDIRFLDYTGIKCDYWIETIASDSSYADIWVEIPRIESGCGQGDPLVEYPYGTATASTYLDANRTPQTAFDKLFTNNGWASSISATSATISWLKMDYGIGNAYVINRYALVNRSDFTNPYMPVKWKLQGSNDDTNWDDLDDKTGSAQATWVQAEVRMFSFKNEKAYRYYRFYFPEAYYSASNQYLVEISDISLYYCPYQTHVNLSSATVTSTSEYTGAYYDHYTTDGSYNVGYWLSADRASSAAETYVRIDLGASTTAIVRNYQLRMGQVNYIYGCRKWKFQGSNDNSTWVTLDDRSASQASAWTACEIRNFSFNNDTPYRYYQVLCTEAYSDGSGHYYVSIGEIYLFEYDFRLQPTTKILVVYGNPWAISESNGANTFLFFDDFLGAVVDTSLWDFQNNPTVSGGIETGTIISKSTFGSGYAARCRSAGTNTNAYLLAWCDQLNMANWDAYRRSVDLGKFAYEKYPTVITTGTITADSNYHTFEIGKISTNSYFSMDGTYDGMLSSCPNPSTACKIINYYTAGTSWDWVFVRRFIVPAPTFGWCSPEYVIPAV